MTAKALYPGSFDPLTNGHVDILRAGFRLCDCLIVAVGVNSTKAPLLSLEERIALIEDVCAPLAEEAQVRFTVRTFNGLVVDFAREIEASILIRGLRDGTDLDYEMQMAGMNSTLAPWLQTVLLPASPTNRHITATLVRQIASMGGNISAFVPSGVANTITSRLAQAS